jgi:hypothetical protein
MGALLGERRSRRAAIGLVAALTRIPGGRWLVAGLGHMSPPRDAAGLVAGIKCMSRVGATVGLAAARDAVSALPALGAGMLEVGPVSAASVEQARSVLDGARAPVALRVGAGDAVAVVRAIGSRAALVIVDVTDSPLHLETLKGVGALVSTPVLAGIESGDRTVLPTDVGVVIRGATPSDVKAASPAARAVIATTSDPSTRKVANLIAAGAATVLATPAALIEAGPGWFHRATLAYLARLGAGEEAPPEPALPWMAGLALGLGMIAGGLGAAIVALGPVLLPYDEAFLDANAHNLATVSPRLIQFLQHDRITLAGTMVAIGILYAALSWWGIREGRLWARNVLLASGVVGFPTLFYFFAYQYVEPVHVALAAVLFPLFVIAVWRAPRGGRHVFEGEGMPVEWQRALIGQLLLVAVGLGLVVGGLTISYVGLTTVFVPTDLAYMSTSAQALAAANHRLLSFIAHDRAGFGGALISVGVAVLLMSSWGWARGQTWIWWSLAGGATAGFGAALAIHIGVAYTDFWHVAPIYAGIIFTAVGLALARPFLCSQPSMKVLAVSSILPGARSE